jgi:hypothetical protein
MNNWFNDFSNWFDDWFKFRDDLDTLFSGSSGESKKDLSLAAIYAIENYKSFKIEANYLILRNYSQNKINTPYKIKRNYSQNKTFAYYKLGLIQPKPLRIVFNA